MHTKGRSITHRLCFTSNTQLGAGFVLLLYVSERNLREQVQLEYFSDLISWSKLRLNRFLPLTCVMCSVYLQACWMNKMRCPKATDWVDFFFEGAHRKNNGECQHISHPLPTLIFTRSNHSFSIRILIHSLAALLRRWPLTHLILTLHNLVLPANEWTPTFWLWAQAWLVSS